MGAFDMTYGYVLWDGIRAVGWIANDSITVLAGT